MAARLLWSPLARADLVKIYVDIALVQPDAAERYYDRIEQRALGLLDYPRMGARRRDIWISTRILVEEPFLILYETIPDTDEGPIEAVEIVRVVHMRQDLTNVSR